MNLKLQTVIYFQNLELISLSNDNVIIVVFQKNTSIINLILNLYNYCTLQYK